jgi:hypothetical protein
MLCRVALVTTNDSEESSASIIKAGELNSNRNTLRGNIISFYFFAACFGCWLLLTLLLARRFLSPWWSKRYVPRKSRFLQDSRGVTSQKTVFFLIICIFAIHGKLRVTTLIIKSHSFNGSQRFICDCRRPRYWSVYLHSWNDRYRHSVFLIL